jgi:hypothetical protein
MRSGLQPLASAVIAEAVAGEHHLNFDPIFVFK